MCSQRRTGAIDPAIPPRTCHTRGVSRLLIIHHSPTRTMQQLTEQVLLGATDDAIEGVEVVEIPALDFGSGAADHRALLAADGYVLGTTANFGYMSGALKHMFDSTFLQIGGALDDSSSTTPGAGGATAGSPLGLYMHGRYDTTGARRSVLSITNALGWKQAFPVVEPLGELSANVLEEAYELGATLAAVVMEGTS
jgi:multimeric flavodoxin WrbA